MTRIMEKFESVSSYFLLISLSLLSLILEERLVSAQGRMQVPGFHSSSLSLRYHEADSEAATKGKSKIKEERQACRL